MEFYMVGESEKNLRIRELKWFSVLAFDWFGDGVRFELKPVAGGCQLIFTEQIL